MLNLKDRLSAMPVAPRKPCRICGQLSNGAYCEKHQRKKQEEVKFERIKYDKERGTSASRGYGSRWSKTAKLYREKNPLCVMCEAKGKLTIAQCVDHIIPVVDKNDLLFWDESNWQSLCLSHHSEKTAKEDGGLGNKKVDRFF